MDPARYLDRAGGQVARILLALFIALSGLTVPVAPAPDIYLPRCSPVEHGGYYQGWLCLCPEWRCEWLAR